MDDLWMILMDDLWMKNQNKFDLWMILDQVSWFITRIIVGFMGG